MVRENDIEKNRNSRIVQISLSGLLLFSASLLVAAGLVTYGFVSYGTKRSLAGKPSTFSTQPTNARPSIAPDQIPPWGELVNADIEIEQPDEYADFEAKSHSEAVWTFSGMSKDQVASVLLECGLSAAQIAKTLARDGATSSTAGTSIKPEDDLVLSMSAEVRAKLYAHLAHFPPNIMMRFPWTIAAGSFDSRFGTNEVDASTHDLLKSLLYERAGIQCFSDYELAMRRAVSDQERFRLVKALSRQSAVLPRLRIRPDTDTGKLVSYWSHGAQAKDLHPLFDSLKRLKDGGSVSLLYVLPSFVRERLCTFPMPSHPGDPALDCNWSAMNFFNDPPDNHFCDPNYLVSFVSTNFYQISKPTMYGDLILFLDDNQTIAHSAVYVADDLVFTKNGNSFVQPWKIMRMKDLVNVYALAVPTQILYYRNRHA
jgi:hypothetical protein